MFAKETQLIIGKERAIRFAKLRCTGENLERALKDDAYRGADDFHFFADRMDAKLWQGVKILAEAGKKVTIETKKKKK